MVVLEKHRVDVSSPFGGPVSLCSELAETTPSEDMALVRLKLASLTENSMGVLRLYRPKPTAAFSPRDTAMPRYAEATTALRSMGFEPVERRAGGQLAVYDENALVIDLVAPHREPRIHIHERFGLFAGAIVSGLIALSIDAKIGALAGEYCPGDYSVNGEGRIKLAGLAQRVVKNGYHLGAVISVTRSDKAKHAIAEAYRTLSIDFDQATFGAITDLEPAMSFDRVCKAIQVSVLKIASASCPSSPPQSALRSQLQ